MEKEIEKGEKQQRKEYRVGEKERSSWEGDKVKKSARKLRGCQ